MNSLDKQYTDLLQTILDYGVVKQDRTGTGTKSIFGYTIRHNMKEGFPLLTTKKLYWKGVVGELLWFLRGETNIRSLVEDGIHIWDGDAYKNYLKLVSARPDIVPVSKEKYVEQVRNDITWAKSFGELGPVYGHQWRSWGTEEEYYNGSEYVWQGRTDQIANLIKDLKENPDSRRLMVTAWNPQEISRMVLPPCHYGFQVYTRELSRGERMDYWFKNSKPNRDVCDSVDELSEKEQHNYFDGANVPKRAISLMWNQRSVDTFLGLPFNIASYGLLLEIIASTVNMVSDQLIGNLGDTHLYLNHLEQAREQIGRDLTLDERIDMASKDKNFDPGDFGVGPQVTDESCHEVCDSYDVPRRTRTPFPLPSLVNGKTGAFYESLSKDLSLLGHLDISDFTLENYQSHPAIKAELSN